MPEAKPTYESSEIERITRNLRTVREAAAPEARAAIRRAETHLVEALGGERLYDAPNLAVSSEPYFGYRIRTRHPDKRLGKSPTLVLSDRGQLTIAWRTQAGLGWRPVDNDELVAEDLPRILEVMELATRRHIDKASRRKARFENIRELADKVTFILGDHE